MKQSCFGLSVGKAELGEGIPDPDFARADSPFNVVSGYLEALFTLKERWKSKNKCVCERERKKRKKRDRNDGKRRISESRALHVAQLIIW